MRLSASFTNLNQPVTEVKIQSQIIVTGSLFVLILFFRKLFLRSSNKSQIRQSLPEAGVHCSFTRWLENGANELRVMDLILNEWVWLCFVLTLCF